MKQLICSFRQNIIIGFLILPLSILPGYSGSLYAQGMNAGDTITTKRGTQVRIIEERSSGMKMAIQAKLANVECGTGDAFRVGWGLEGDYFLPKWASVHAAYVGSYFNTQKMSAATLNKGNNTLKGFSNLEIGGRFHIVDKKSLKRFKTKLSNNASFVDQYNSGGAIPENYLIARLPARRIFALRGGFYRVSAIANTDMNKKELTVRDNGAVKAADGLVFSDVYYTMAHTTGVYVGLSELFNIWTLITPVNVTEFTGTYHDAILKEVYADLLFAGTTFDPFMTTGIAHAITPNAAGSFRTSPIGFRIGKKMVVTRKTLNLGYSFEIGSRPGVQGRGLYFSSGISVAFVK